MESKGQQKEQQISCALQSSSATPSNFMNKEEEAYELGELEQALFLYLDAQGDHSEQRSGFGFMCAETTHIFPSQPVHEEEPSLKGRSVSLVPSSGSGQKTSEKAKELNHPIVKNSKAPVVKHEGNNRKGKASDQEGPRTLDPRTLRRLAQNRAAARKSRLRKKAYVQQLESNRIRLSQIEQELQRSRIGFPHHQSVFFGGDQGLQGCFSELTSEAAMFDMEYSRWLDKHQRVMSELRAAMEEQLPENELRVFVESCLVHYNEMVNLTSIAAKTDVFHLVSGIWKTPAERCFMWIGGFRPSDLIKIVVRRVEPLSEQQLIGICGLQQSTQEMEDGLKQGLKALYNSLSETMSSEALTFPSNMANYMGQMAVAMNKLSTLEVFADNLRQQTLHRIHQVLTVHQAARGFLAFAEYFHRLRALSSLWLARPRQE